MTIRKHGGCTCYVANEIKLHGSSTRPHMFWCAEFDPMATPAPWARQDLKGPALDRRGIVAELTGGEPAAGAAAIAREINNLTMPERALKAIEEVHAPPADASRMGAPRTVGNFAAAGLSPALLAFPVVDGGDPMLDSTLLRVREGDQPLPVLNDYPAIQDLVIADMEARKAVGIARYGTLLKPHDGRDPLLDLYQELMDGANYVRKLMFERDGK